MKKVNPKSNLTITSFKDIWKILKANLPLFAIILFLILGTFIWSINGEFVSDDLPGIVRNPEAHDLNNSIASLNPQRIVYSLIWNTFGAKPAPFHAFSMVMHFVNVVLFFIIAYNLFGKRIAALATVLYTVHPVVSETVIWISALNYLFSTMFLYICTLCYLIYVKNKDIKWLIALFVLFAIFSFTFPSYWVLIIPFFIAGLDFFVLEQNFNFKSLVKTVPLFVIGVASFFAISGEGRVTERVARLNTDTATPFINRIPYSIYHNLEVLFFPKNLTIYHEGVILTPAKYAVMIAISIILVITTFILWRNKKTRLIAGMTILIFISIMPVFSPILVAWMIAERYLYVGVALFCTLIAMLFIFLGSREKNKDLALILTVILVVIYSGRSIARAQEWKTRKSLWLSAEKRGPYSARAHNNLGDVYGVEGNWEKSIYHFRRAIEINPYYSEAIHNLANTLMQLGYLDQARELFLQSIEINPQLYQATHKLGLIEYEMGNEEVAMDYFRRTLEIEPGYAPAIQSIQALQTLQQRNQ